VKILNGLSLSISRGQKVAVVGESGSGKSTVMALLERTSEPVGSRPRPNTFKGTKGRTWGVPWEYHGNM